MPEKGTESHGPGTTTIGWKERMPMGEPFLFLDHAELTETGARGRYRITGNEPALRGHFKNSPVMPASLMLEALGQLGVFFLLHHAQARAAAGGEVRPETIFLSSCDGVRCSRFCRPGDELELEVTARRVRAPLAGFSGAVFAGARERAVRAEEIVLGFGA